MRKLVIFGNSGSGKSTLAKKIAEDETLGYFDLDTVAWLPLSDSEMKNGEKAVPTRKPIADSMAEIEEFISAVESEGYGWVIEGCYGDLLTEVMKKGNEIAFLDLPIDVCISHAKHRAWEPHKYPSKEAQDANLDMLIAWISDYEMREDSFSRAYHRSLYDNFTGVRARFSE